MGLNVVTLPSTFEGLGLDTKIKTCYDEIELYAQNIDHLSKFHVHTIGKAYVII